MSCWNKKWQWLTGLNNARLKLHQRIKWQTQSGGNLTKIACYLKKKSTGRRVTFSFRATALGSLEVTLTELTEGKGKTGEKKKSTYSAPNPTASHTAVWRLSCPPFSLPCTPTKRHGSFMCRSGSAGPEQQQWKDLLCLFLSCIFPRRVPTPHGERGKHHLTCPS